MPLWEIVVTFVLRNDGWPTQASFAWVGVFVVTTKIPALAKRWLERETRLQEATPDASLS